MKEPGEKIVLIGSGNVATCIALDAVRQGLRLECVWSRSMAHAEALASQVGACAADDLQALPRDAGLYVVAVKDDALDEVVEGLPRIPDGLFVHTAGCRSVDVFAGRENHYGVLYPMQSFTKGRALDFSSVPCFLEADSAESLLRLRNFAACLSDHLYEMDTPKRQLLHLAAVFASNFSNHCYVQAERLLEQAGIPFDVMLPLIDETAAKTHAMSPLKGQTGPARRGDDAAVEREGRLLDGDDALKKLYDLMSRSIKNTYNHD